jgi:hypothetical protein
LTICFKEKQENILRCRLCRYALLFIINISCIFSICCLLSVMCAVKKRPSTKHYRKFKTASEMSRSVYDDLMKSKLRLIRLSDGFYIVIIIFFQLTKLVNKMSAKRVTPSANYWNLKVPSTLPKFQSEKIYNDSNMLPLPCWFCRG